MSEFRKMFAEWNFSPRVILYYFDIELYLKGDVK